MNNSTALGLATLVVILNGLIGHFLAPSGILLTPVILIITTSLVCFGTKNIKVIFLSFLVYLFIALNDFSIKLYSGGSHDSEGIAWIHLLLFVGLIPTFVIFLVAVFINGQDTLINKIIAIVLFVGLIVLHLQLFMTLGLGRYYWYE